MQNKKSLLQRLLVIYVAFFVVLAMSLFSGVNNFVRGFNSGMQLSEEITGNIYRQTPRQVYILTEVPISEHPEIVIPTADTTRSVRAFLGQIVLSVSEQIGDDTSPATLAFRSIGRSAWIYAGVMLIPLMYLAVVILMILIIHSVRRSIRNEQTLDRRCTWWLRAIGILTIATELLSSTVAWAMSRRAAEVLAGSPYAVDTSFSCNTSTLIMGILVLFAAEVFAVGQNLSEEQRLTI